VPNWDQANGINSLGDIVGYVNDQNGISHAAVWSMKHPTVVILIPQLPNQIWSDLTAVNDSGVAVGAFGTADLMHGLAVDVH